MSKSYNLRNRTAASNVLRASSSSPDPERRLYSDVAASRPPSPSKDMGNPSVATGNAGQTALGVTSISDAVSSKKYMFPTHDYAHREVSEDVSEEPESGSPWHTVGRRRARSLDSTELAPKKTGQRAQDPKEKIPVPPTQQNVEAPTMTETIPPETSHARREKESESRGEESSKPKGKGRDPREWGNVNLTAQEMDADLQQAAYESYKRQHQYEKERKKKKYSSRPNRGSELQSTPS
jgi:hypothetical protein